MKVGGIWGSKTGKSLQESRGAKPSKSIKPTSMDRERCTTLIARLDHSSLGAGIEKAQGGESHREGLRSRKEKKGRKWGQGGRVCYDFTEWLERGQRRGEKTAHESVEKLLLGRETSGPGGDERTVGERIPSLTTGQERRKGDGGGGGKKLANRAEAGG